MPCFWTIAAILVILYLLWIGIFYYGWTRTPFNPDTSSATKMPVTVVVPVRDEENNILRLLNDLVIQDFPPSLMEIIIVDDHSTDLTPVIVSDFACTYTNIRSFRLENNFAGKKAALRKGISEARNSFILTTDADCRPSSGWVGSMVEYYGKTKADLVAGPVLIISDKGLLNAFQRLELFGLLGSTAGSLYSGNPVMASSANLGFSKESYLRVSEQIREDLSSGDDVFLLLGMYKLGIRNLKFLKNRNAIVTTAASSSLKEFMIQRKRWASKSRHYKSGAAVFTALLIFLIHFYALICLISGLFYFPLLPVALFIYVLKSALDFPFLYSVTGYFGERSLMKYFPVIQLFYFFYICFTAIAAFTGNFDWKGRVVKG